jgi:hypothetical protein
VILTFDTTHHALWAEELALARRLGVGVVPAPSDSGAKCDLALEVLAEDGALLVEVLRQAGVPHRVYPD